MLEVVETITIKVDYANDTVAGSFEFEFSQEDFITHEIFEQYGADASEKEAFEAADLRFYEALSKGFESVGFPNDYEGDDYPGWKAYAKQ